MDKFFIFGHVTHNTPITTKRQYKIQKWLARSNYWCNGEYNGRLNCLNRMMQATIVICLCILGKCSSWGCVTMTYDIRQFNVWRACFPSLQVHRFYTSKVQAIYYYWNLKAMVFRKLPNLVSRQAKGATSNETANIQSSSDNESTLAYSPRSSPTAHNVLVTVVTKRKMSKRKM